MTTLTHYSRPPCTYLSQPACARHNRRGPGLLSSLSRPSSSNIDFYARAPGKQRAGCPALPCRGTTWAAGGIPCCANDGETACQRQWACGIAWLAAACMVVPCCAHTNQMPDLRGQRVQCPACAPMHCPRARHAPHALPHSSLHAPNCLHAAQPHRTRCLHSRAGM